MVNMLESYCELAIEQTDSVEMEKNNPNIFQVFLLLIQPCMYTVVQEIGSRDKVSRCQVAR